MKAVIDSSVAVKWFVREAGYETAKVLLGSSDRFIAPDFLIAEVTNVLWRKARQQEIEIEQVQEAIRELPRYFDSLLPATELASEAFELARVIQHSVYDCMFLACALKFEDTALVIADEKVASKIAAAGFADRIRRIGTDPLTIVFSEKQLKSLLDLYSRSEQIFQTLEEKVKKPFGESGMTIVRSQDLRPAFNSPTYVRLQREIAKLTPHQAGLVLATAWLGRGYDGGDFERLLAQAQFLAANPAQHSTYIISLIGHLERGIEKLRSMKLYDSNGQED